MKGAPTRASALLLIPLQTLGSYYFFHSYTNNFFLFNLKHFYATFQPNSGSHRWWILMYKDVSFSVLQYCNFFTPRHLHLNNWNMYAEEWLADADLSLYKPYNTEWKNACLKASGAFAEASIWQYWKNVCANWANWILNGQTDFPQKSAVAWESGTENGIPAWGFTHAYISFYFLKKRTSGCQMWCYS